VISNDRLLVKYLRICRHIMFRPLVCLNSLRIQHDPDGPGDHFGHPHFRSDRLPHGSGVTGSDDQRTGDGKVQRWLQSVLARLLAQLLLHTVRTPVSQVSPGSLTRRFHCRARGSTEITIINIQIGLPIIGFRLPFPWGGNLTANWNSSIVDCKPPNLIANYLFAPLGRILNIIGT